MAWKSRRTDSARSHWWYDDAGYDLRSAFNTDLLPIPAGVFRIITIITPGAEALDTDGGLMSCQVYQSSVIGTEPTVATDPYNLWAYCDRDGGPTLNLTGNTHLDATNNTRKVFHMQASSSNYGMGDRVLVTGPAAYLRFSYAETTAADAVAVPLAEIGLYMVEV